VSSPTEVYPSDFTGAL